MNFFIVVIAKSVLIGQPGAVIIEGPAMPRAECEATVNAPVSSPNATWTCLTQEQVASFIGDKHECYREALPGFIESRKLDIAAAAQLGDKISGHSSMIAVWCKS